MFLRVFISEHAVFLLEEEKLRSRYFIYLFAISIGYKAGIRDRQKFILLSRVVMEAGALDLCIDVRYFFVLLKRLISLLFPVFLLFLFLNPAMICLCLQRRIHWYLFLSSGSAQCFTFSISVEKVHVELLFALPR